MLNPDPNPFRIKTYQVLLTRLEQENPQWINIFQNYPDWRVFLIKEGKIYPSRHLEEKVVFLKEIINNGYKVQGRYNNNKKRKPKKSVDPFKVVISLYTKRCQQLDKRKERPRNLRQFNGTEKLFVERRLEDYTAEWAKEKSRLGRLDYLKRQRKSKLEKGLDSSTSSSSFSSPATTIKENDENKDTKNIKGLDEEELKLQNSMTEISRFQKLQHLQNQQRIRVPRENLNAKENEMISSTPFPSKISSKSPIELELEDIIIEDQDQEQEQGNNDWVPFFDNTCNNIDDNSIDPDLLIFDPIEEKETLELLFECFNDCDIFNQSNHS